MDGKVTSLKANFEINDGLICEVTDGCQDVCNFGLEVDWSVTHKKLELLRFSVDEVAIVAGSITLMCLCRARKRKSSCRR